jgi:hypothetical protein
VVIAAVSVAKHRKKRLVFVQRLSVATAVVIPAVITVVVVAAGVVGVDVDAVVIMINIHLTTHHRVMVPATDLLRVALVMVHLPAMVRHQGAGEVGKA